MLPSNIPILLNDRAVEKITAFLFHAGGNDDPAKLKANENKSFQGSIVLGMGFTFDDSNSDATPIAEMHRLIAENPKNAEVIFPYIGGEEVNSNPTHAHHRYVINFGEMSEEEAREIYPDLMAIVEEKVKPQRMKLKNNSDGKRAKATWWLFCRSTPGLKRAIEPLDRVLVTACGATAHLQLAFIPSNMVYANTLAVIAYQDYSIFTILQSRFHDIWSRFFGSSMKDDLRYTPSNCFETFPFPFALNSPDSVSPLTKDGGVESNSPTNIKDDLEAIGQKYYEYRSNLMVRNNEGLTDTYNRFHDPYETDTEILKLRELHEEMDKAVLKAYGWDDIDTTCGFALDYLDIEDEGELPSEAQERIATGDYFFATADEAMNFDGMVRTGNRKLPWRYRWGETTHDEVLARLLELNRQRGEEEALMGVGFDRNQPHNKGFKGVQLDSNQRQKKAPSKKKKKVDEKQGTLNL